VTAHPIRIEGLHASTPGGRFRVEAVVDGHSVWFESQDAALVPAPEAWASAFLIPSLHLHRPLETDPALDRLWASNVSLLAKRARRAWGYRQVRQDFTESAVGAPVPAGRGSGLLFTGGVDSFHALLCSAERPDVLINVHGFDVALADTAHHEAARRSIDAIAAETGKRTLYVRTNLREHPLILDTPWDAAHGGALAAVGHVLGGRLERVAISSSQPRWSVNPWGSHWSTDPLWSSRTVEFVHLDPDIHRLDKVRRIAPHPLVHRHLRVCWHETGPRLNCSRCEKCMLTMLCLAEAGHLADCTVFEPVDLVAFVRSRRRSRWRLPILHLLARSPRLDPELRRELRAMWWRSVLWRSTGIRWSVRIARRMLGLARPRAPGRTA